MRLWHEDLIKVLPKAQLLGQHRECCALRGNGWARKHKTVDYVFEHSPIKLYQYHILVMDEMIKRGYKPDELWKNQLYRGKSCEAYKNIINNHEINHPIYPEHNDTYLKECLRNLYDKGIEISI